MMWLTLLIAYFMMSLYNDVIDGLKHLAIDLTKMIALIIKLFRK